MSNSKPIKIAVLWHMHQPNYQEPGSSRMVMPWVRLHAIKDYLDMPILATKYDHVKTTFNLVPSLLDQLQLYVDGGTDPHLELTSLNSELLSEDQKRSILEKFFMANQKTMIEPYRRYFELFKKAKAGHDQEVIPAIFSSEEIRDIQVWSNLCWVDPSFHNDKIIKGLLEKERHFSEEDKHALINWQTDTIARIVPTYKDLLQSKRLDISFTPYYHPILPLLCDTDVAREAMPQVELPKKRFIHPEDARFQIESAVQKYRELFGKDLAGMWPSEGSVSEEAIKIMASAGIKWIATDEEVLYFSLKKSGQDPARDFLPTVYDYDGGVKMFFRDHALSDRIGFVYSSWDADVAVNDFMQHLHKTRERLAGNLDEVLIPIILDGENAWEHFANDGHDFLDEFYRRIGSDPLVEMVSFEAAAGSVPARPLKTIFAGSWINHNFRIWIGHSEDNAAWDLLGSARDTLVEFEKNNPNYPAEKIKSAWRQIYIAQGSDWCWWYGDEHRGMNNEEFDEIFRRHLMAIYELIGQDIPFGLLNPIYRSTAVYESLIPDALISPEIDGRVTHYYEWTGAGMFDCSKAGDAMHQVQRVFSHLFYAYDHHRIHIRLDFVDKKQLKSLGEPRLEIQFVQPAARKISVDLNGGYQQMASNGIQCAVREVVEISLDRSLILTTGSGQIEFNINLFDGNNKIEAVPASSTIRIDIPLPDHEMFWPV